MSCAVKVSGAWKYAKQVYVNVSGTWKECKNIYVNVSGAWKPLYTYSYQTGGWGDCSADCGGGTQTRTVTCQRRDVTTSTLDVQTVADSFCTAHGLEKPAASRTCNTQECQDCKFSATGFDSDPCAGNTPPNVTYGWRESIDSLTPMLTVSILWNTNVIASESIIEGNVTSKVVEGYLYIRSTQQGTCTTSSLIPPSTVISSTYKLYTVCRQAV